MSRTIQIRDVDDATYTALRTRAAAEHLSLTAYLRRELNNLATAPDVDDWFRRAANRDRGVSTEEIVRSVHEARAEEGE